MYVPAVTAVGYWFEKKRSLVTGEMSELYYNAKKIRNWRWYTLIYTLIYPNIPRYTLIYPDIPRCTLIYPNIPWYTPCSGISTCGSGFGTIVFAPVVTALLQVSNWQWTNRIIAGFCLLVISCTKYVNMSALFPLICIVCSVHPAWSDHETCAKAKVWQHRQHHRNEKEKRANYQGRLEEMFMIRYFMTLSS